jgi:endo-1,3(4)-beta-glucanase
MLPQSPISGYIKSPAFVSEEWSTYFSNGRVDKVAEPWRSILYANLALIDPKTSWNYFDSPQFNWAQLDSGASWTWYLAYAAGLGGAA